MEKRIRSPNYPALSLKDAVEKASMLYRANHRHTAPRDVVAKAIGYTGLNGASATAISALNKYGLLEGRGEDLRISERAMSILHPHSKEERVQALKAAATEPKLFAELAERFPGGVQNDELLRNYLLRNEFAASAVTSVIQAYRETSEFVAREAEGYDSSSAIIEDDDTVQVTPPVSVSKMPPAAAPTQVADIERVLHRFDFAGGGFVKIIISRDVDASLALKVIETSLPTMKTITDFETEQRKSAKENSDAN